MELALPLRCILNREQKTQRLESLPDRQGMKNSSYWMHCEDGLYADDEKYSTTNIVQQMSVATELSDLVQAHSEGMFSIWI